MYDLSEDVFFQREYSALYESEAEYFEYIYEEKNRYVKFSSLKRPILSVSGVPLVDELYDLETHYGYGGPYSNCQDYKFLQNAFKSYRSYCSSLNIVCEFIRFHPFNKLSSNRFLYDMHQQQRNVVVVDLIQSSQDRRNCYQKTTRNIIKNASKNLNLEIDNVCFQDFYRIYKQTMEKNAADSFFFFNKKYFHDLMKINSTNLLAIKKNNQYVSLGFFLLSKYFSYYHLSANEQNFRNENGNYLLLDYAFEFAKLQNCKFMILGGGRTDLPDDPLFRFKKKFSPIIKPFYIAGIDFLPEKRKFLNLLWKNKNDDKKEKDLFQMYRF